MCRKLVGLNMFKNIIRFFVKNIGKPVARLSNDNRTTFVRVSGTCRREILANLQCDNFATLVRMSFDSHATVLPRKHANNSHLSVEKIKLSDIHTNVSRLSYE